VVGAQQPPRGAVVAQPGHIVETHHARFRHGGSS
jgi:hypothetical protein